MQMQWSNTPFGAGAFSAPFLLYLCLGLLSALAFSATAAGAGNEPRFFDTYRSADFGPAERPLRSLMASKGVPRRRVDAFCIVGYNSPDAGQLVYVYWPRERQLILWDGGNRTDSLIRSRRVLDLRKDVVATDADIGGSTYLVTRTWVAQKIADCAAHGRQYRVSRR